MTIYECYPIEIGDKYTIALRSKDVQEIRAILKEMKNHLDTIPTSPCTVRTYAVNFYNKLCSHKLDLDDIAFRKSKNECCKSGTKTTYREFNDMTDAYQDIIRCDKCGSKI